MKTSQHTLFLVSAFFYIGCSQESALVDVKRADSVKQSADSQKGQNPEIDGLGTNKRLKPEAKGNNGAHNTGEDGSGMDSPQLPPTDSAIVRTAGQFELPQGEIKSETSPISNTVSIEDKTVRTTSVSATAAIATTTSVSSSATKTEKPAASAAPTPAPVVVYAPIPTPVVVYAPLPIVTAAPSPVLVATPKICDLTGMKLDTSSLVLRPAEAHAFTTSLPAQSTAKVTWKLIKPANSVNNMGSISTIGQYVAPNLVEDNSTKLVVEATASNSNCTVTAKSDLSLIPSSSFAVEDDNKSDGLTGNVYDFLGNQVSKLPDFSLMQPVSSILMPNVNIPLRSFDAGFPGITDLFEWFGIRFTGKIIIPAAGQYTFALQSDDGANLYIDNKIVIDNDGLHASQRKTAKVTLTSGEHDIRIDYYQGPRYHIELVLFWLKPGAKSEEVIPSTQFRRSGGTLGR